MYNFKSNVGTQCVDIKFSSAPQSLVPKMDNNELDDEYENPLEFTKADNRFFYIKKSGENYALEAMDGGFISLFYP